MPRASVWMIRAALLYLVAGAAIGGWLLAARDGTVPAPPSGLLAAHAIGMAVGWMIQVTLAVGYWILPRHPREPARGPAWAPWVAGGLLNAGVLAVAGGWATGGLVSVGGGVVVFVATQAPRIKAFGAER